MEKQKLKTPSYKTMNIFKTGFGWIKKKFILGAFMGNNHCAAGSFKGLNKIKSCSEKSDEEEGVEEGTFQATDVHFDSD